LNEERAIVSEIAGTTRDTVEDEMIIGGLRFRFIDTAGIRDTVDIIEAKGVERTHEKIKQAKLIIYLVDPEQDVKEIESQISYLKELNIPFLTVVNKKDLVSKELEEKLSVVSCQLSEGDELSVGSSNKSVAEVLETQLSEGDESEEQKVNKIIFISAKNKIGIEDLKSSILEKVNLHKINTDDVLISNIRHLEALQKTEESLNRVLLNIDNPITSDFLASDIKQALYYLGEITGQVTTDDLLEKIFSKFCIGK
jgi:tRNA modification GTPase